MKETEEVATRRKGCLEMKLLLQKAMEIVNEVYSYEKMFLLIYASFSYE